MMHRTNAATRSLLSLQAARPKIEADPQAYDRGERIEHHMTLLMTDVIADQLTVSPHDPEFHTTETEICSRYPHPSAHPSPGTRRPRSCQPAPPTRPAPSHPTIRNPDHRKLRTRPRHPAATPTRVTASPPRQGTSVHATRARSPVSPHDPESAHRKLRLIRDTPPTHLDGARPAPASTSPYPTSPPRTLCDNGLHLPARPAASSAPPHKHRHPGASISPATLATPCGNHPPHDTIAA